MTCKKCGASLKYEEGSTKLICPFCGSEEILPESDDVQIEKIRSRTVRDLEGAKLSYAKEMEEANRCRMQQDKFKNGKGSKFLILAGIICLIACLLSFGKGYILAGMVAFLQTALFVGGWVIGMGYVKKVKSGLCILAAVLAIALMVPFFGAQNRAENRQKTAVEYIWPDHGPALMLDQPESKYGKIVTNSEDYFDIDIYRVKEQDFRDYVEKCREKGFNADEYNQSDYYRAENGNKDSLTLSYSSDEQQMSISISGYIEPESEEIIESVVESVVESIPESVVESVAESVPEPAPAEADGAANAVGADGLRSEFKAAMDSYEEFYDQYVVIMKKIADNPGDLSVLSEYTDMKAKAEEVDKNFEAWDDDMNDAEMKYYIDVQARVTKKMLDAMEE